MLGAINVHQINPEQRVRKPATARRVGEVDMDDEQREGGENYAESEIVEADKCIARPENTIAVAVEELAVLLEHGLVAVLLGPVAFGCAVGFVVGCSDVGAGKACE